MRILVTGSRDWDDEWVIARALREVEEAHPEAERFHLIHGGASGADKIAEGFAWHYGWTTHPYYPDWRRDGKAAGPIRNKQMVDSKPDICLAFIKNKSRGASHCAGLAEKAGIETVRYEIDDDN